MTDIHEADPIARRRGLWIIAGGAVTGAVLLTVAGELRPEFAAWVTQDVSTRLRIVSAVVTLMIVGPVLGLAAYYWHLGRRTVGAARYPPPGLRVVRDTPIVTGETAHRRGRVMQALAAMLAGASLLVAFLVWRLFRFLPHHRPDTSDRCLPVTSSCWL